MKLKALYETKAEPHRPITWGILLGTMQSISETFQNAGYYVASSHRKVPRYPQYSWAQVRVTNEKWTYDGQMMVTIEARVKDWPNLTAELFKWFEGDTDHQDEGIDINLNDENAMDELWGFIRETMPLQTSASKSEAS
jgi:hypothetical protein